MIAEMCSSVLGKRSKKYSNPHTNIVSAYSLVISSYRCFQCFIHYIFLDLHAAPGKQNANSHSGTSKPPTFFSSKHNMQHTTHILTTLLSHLNQFLYSHSPPLPNLIGIELINEPDPPSDASLQSWYTTSIQKLRSVDATIPLYIGERWRLDAYSDWLVQSHDGGDALTVLDHHLYRCFTSSDINIPAADHTRALDPEADGHTFHYFTSLSEKLGLVSGGSGIVVGEWSGALNPGSLSTSSSGGWEETKQYVDAQIRLYDKTCAGYFFWTFKKQHPGDFGWSLRDAVGAGTFPDRLGLRPTIPGGVIEPDDVARAKSDIMNRACGEDVFFFDVDETINGCAENHRKWWSQYPGSYEHWKFDDGFSKGWDEALRFLMFDLSGNNSLTELGFTRAWARLQTEDHGSNYWEFEHGFLQAVNEARNFFQNHFGYA